MLLRIMNRKTAFRFFILLSSLIWVPVLWGTANCASAGSAAAESELSVIDSGLYDSGTFDFPVTIAKLESDYDTSQMTQTVTPVTAESQSAPLLTDSGILHDTVITYEVTVTAGPLAITQPTIATNIRAYYLDDSDATVTESETTTTVSEDGSFAFTIGLPTRDTTFYFMMGNADQTKFGPPVFSVEIDDTGERAFIMSNSSKLSALKPQKKAGAYKLVVLYEDGQTTIVRQSLNGTDTEILAQFDGELTHLTALDGKISWIDDSGTLTLLIPESDIETDLTTFNPYDATVTKMFIQNDGVFVATQQVNGTLDFFSTSSGDGVALVRESDAYLDAKFTLSAESSTLYALVSTSPELYSIFQAPTDSVAANFWENKDQVTDIDASIIYSMDASDNGLVVFDGETNNGRQIFLLTCSEGCLEFINDPATDTNEYANPIVSPDGTFVVMCKLASDDTGNQIVYHHVDVDAAGTVNALTSRPTFEFCDDTPGTYFIDENNVLHFYLTRLSDGFAQQARRQLQQDLLFF